MPTNQTRKRWSSFVRRPNSFTHGLFACRSVEEPGSKVCLSLKEEPEPNKSSLTQVLTWSIRPRDAFSSVHDRPWAILGSESGRPARNRPQCAPGAFEAEVVRLYLRKPNQMAGANQTAQRKRHTEL